MPLPPESRLAPEFKACVECKNQNLYWQTPDCNGNKKQIKVPKAVYFEEHPNGINFEYHPVPSPSTFKISKGSYSSSWTAIATYCSQKLSYFNAVSLSHIIRRSRSNKPNIFL